MFTSGKAANFIGDMIFLFMVLSFIYIFISIKRYHFSKKHPWKNVFAWVSYCLLVAGLLFTFIEYNKTQRNPIGTSSLFLETYADNAILHPKVYEAADNEIDRKLHIGIYCKNEVEVFKETRLKKDLDILHECSTKNKDSFKINKFQLIAQKFKTGEYDLSKLKLLDYDEYLLNEGRSKDYFYLTIIFLIFLIVVTSCHIIQVLCNMIYKKSDFIKESVPVGGSISTIINGEDPGEGKCGNFLFFLFSRTEEGMSKLFVFKSIQKALCGLVLLLTVFLFFFAISSLRVPFGCGALHFEGNPSLWCVDKIERKNSPLTNESPCLEEILNLYEDINEENYLKAIQCL